MTDTYDQPLHDRVLVQLLPPDFLGERKSEGGIIIPDLPGNTSSSPQNPVRTATVLRVGTGEILYNGEIRKLAVQEGDVVLVHESDVLPIEPYDPSAPMKGLVSERSILSKKVTR